MFRIKICGVTTADDAVLAADAGADAIGLNFYEQSPRCVDFAIAREVASTVAGKALAIGVFVNHAPPALCALCARIPLNGVQLHGDESAADVAAISAALHHPAAENRPLILRVRRLGAGGVVAVADDLAALRRAGVVPGGLLVDAAAPGSYGGSGVVAPWQELTDRPWLGDVPLILAGGLTPDNVAAAIRIVRPYGVDVASGVESAPGKKDPAKVRDFIAAAREALAL